ncbi:protein kinase [Paraburkholderia sp. 31.1]|uniref:serine/threonine protein kinase n=1 Tax=Paraburkholderia sp. 31.1 TaxID=2615205 RepID=UPI001655CF5F|nr:protein kinase [Paraburkholderia sp. 31.1]MBC8725744.1 protein kinase [Paraburkholderia sp. 31.1]
MSSKRKPLTKVGNWQLGKNLGRGGNGKVVLATNGGQTAAVKILTKGDQPRRVARFRDEIVAMQKCEHLGCIPVIDYEVPDNPSDERPAWFAMQLAQPMMDALGDAPTLVEVVTSVRDIAHLLTEMHALEVTHRDIKPDNLFKYEGKWTAGDFGLADFEGKESLTLEGERIGPVFYMAPEMLNDAPDADGAPADVYSLAKTLWVLVTGQHFPLPGTLSTSIEALRASSYVSDARAVLLNAILEAATKHVASERPSMAAFARELDIWLAPPVHNPDVSELDLSELAPVLAVPKYQMEAAQAASNEHQQRVNETGERVREKLRPMVNQLKDALTNANFIGVGAQVDNYYWGGELQATVPREDGINEFARLKMTVNCDFNDAASAKISATYRTSRDKRPPVDVWTETVNFLPGGSEEDSEINRLLSAICAQFKPVIQQVLELNQSINPQNTLLADDSPYAQMLSVQDNLGTTIAFDVNLRSHPRITGKTVEVGQRIDLVALAIDPKDEPLEYQFKTLHQTADSGWTDSNAWTYEFTAGDIGEACDISVRVRSKREHHRVRHADRAYAHDDLMQLRYTVVAASPSD